MNDPQMKRVNRDQYLVELIKEKLDSQSPLLDLGYEGLGDAGLIFLTRTGDLAHVKVLNLSWNEITSIGIKALAEATSLKNLTHLLLNSNKIGDAGAAAAGHTDCFAGAGGASASTAAATAAATADGSRSAAVTLSTARSVYGSLPATSAT